MAQVAGICKPDSPRHPDCIKTYPAGRSKKIRAPGAGPFP
jgi:hypothetical protein